MKKLSNYIISFGLMAKKNKYLVFIGQAMDIKDKKLQIY